MVSTTLYWKFEEFAFVFRGKTTKKITLTAAKNKFKISIPNNETSEV